MPQIGLQLYSLRDQIAQDFAGTVRRVAEIGYTGIETAFFEEGITPAEAGKLFRSLGLTVMSAHCPLPFGPQRDFALCLLEGLECSRAIWHGWPKDTRYGTPTGIRELATIYNEANAIFRADGRSFGLHNHWWEFEGRDGERPWQQILPYLSPDIFFEIDTYWIQTAGLDPAQVLTEIGERAPLVHIKDGPALVEADMVAVGSGSLNIPAIACAAQTTAEWLIVELDSCATDIWKALEQSYRYLTENGFAR